MIHTDSKVNIDYNIITNIDINVNSNLDININYKIDISIAPIWTITKSTIIVIVYNISPGAENVQQWMFLIETSAAASA